MPLTKISITIPGSIWIAKASAEYSDTTFRVVSTQYDNGTATGLIEIEGDDALQALAQANQSEDITAVELLWKNENETVVQVETDNPLLLLPASRAGVPLRTPFVISDGIASWEVFSSRSKLSQLADEFDELGIEYDIESIREIDAVERDTVLTPRQWEVLSAAFEAGYYDTPRETSLTQVAESLDVAKSTCSDVLHRSEGKIIEQYMDSITPSFRL